MRLGECLSRMEAAFIAAGIDSARQDARALAAHVLGLSAAQILVRADQILSGSELQAVEAAGRRRAAREPVSRIIGRRGFWSLDLLVTPDTLDPRPDTETVVETVLAAEGDHDKPLRILDLGTGTGAILLVLLKEFRHASGHGVDLSVEALEVARLNAKANAVATRLTLTQGRWDEGLPEASFDVAVSNPPYLTAADMAALEPEVRYDPRLALDGGEDGLDAYRALAPALYRVLKPGGLAALEVGRGQAVAVAKMLAEQGFSGVAPRFDLGGVARVVAGRR